MHTHTLPPGTYLRQKPGVVLEQELGELTVAEVFDAVSFKQTQVVIACQGVTVLTVLPAEQSKAGVMSELSPQNPYIEVLTSSTLEVIVFGNKSY